MYLLTLYFDYVDKPDWRTAKLKEKFLTITILNSIRDYHANLTLDLSPYVQEASKVFNQALETRLQNTENQINKLKLALRHAGLVRNVMVTSKELRALEDACQNTFMDVNVEPYFVRKAFEKVSADGFRTPENFSPYRIEILEKDTDQQD